MSRVRGHVALSDCTSIHLLHGSWVEESYGDEETWPQHSTLHPPDTWITAGSNIYYLVSTVPTLQHIIGYRSVQY